MSIAALRYGSGTFVVHSEMRSAHKLTRKAPQKGGEDIVESYEARMSVMCQVYIQGRSV